MNAADCRVRCSGDTATHPVTLFMHVSGAAIEIAVIDGISYSMDSCLSLDSSSLLVPVYA